MMNKKGFTLVELMVVIVIIGVLAAVAIPKFSAATNKAKASEFPTVLSNIVTAQKTNYAEVNEYVNCATASGYNIAPDPSTAGNILSNLGIEVPSSAYFTYTSPSTTPSTQFDATATLAKSKLGAVAIGATATVDEAGAKTASGAGATSLSSLAKSFYAK